MKETSGDWVNNHDLNQERLERSWAVLVRGGYVQPGAEEAFGIARNKLKEVFKKGILNQAISDELADRGIKHYGSVQDAISNFAAAFNEAEQTAIINGIVERLVRSLSPGRGVENFEQNRSNAKRLKMELDAYLELLRNWDSFAASDFAEVRFAVLMVLYSPEAKDLAKAVAKQSTLWHRLKTFFRGRVFQEVRAPRGRPGTTLLLTHRTFLQAELGEFVSKVSSFGLNDFVRKNLNRLSVIEVGELLNHGKITPATKELMATRLKKMHAAMNLSRGIQTVESRLHQLYEQETRMRSDSGAFDRSALPRVDLDEVRMQLKAFSQFHRPDSLYRAAHNLIERVVQEYFVSGSDFQAIAHDILKATDFIAADESRVNIVGALWRASEKVRIDQREQTHIKESISEFIEKIGQSGENRYADSDEHRRKGLSYLQKTWGNGRSPRMQGNSATQATIESLASEISQLELEQNQKRKDLELALQALAARADDPSPVNEFDLILQSAATTDQADTPMRQSEERTPE